MAVLWKQNMKGTNKKVWGHFYMLAGKWKSLNNNNTTVQLLYYYF